MDPSSADCWVFTPKKSLIWEECGFWGFCHRIPNHATHGRKADLHLRIPEPQRPSPNQWSQHAPLSPGARPAAGLRGPRGPEIASSGRDDRRRGRRLLPPARWRDPRRAVPGDQRGPTGRSGPQQLHSLVPKGVALGQRWVGSAVGIVSPETRKCRGLSSGGETEAKASPNTLKTTPSFISSPQLHTTPHLRATF